MKTAGQSERLGERASRMGNFATTKQLGRARTTIENLLTASGCFHGHDKLLSMAPIVMEASFPESGLGGVSALLAADIASWRL